METDARTCAGDTRQWVILPGILFLPLAAFLLTPGTAAGASVQKKNAQPPPALHQNSPDQDDSVPAPEEMEEKEREAARAAVIQKMSAEALAEVRSAADSVPNPDLAALARALGVEAGGPPAADPEAAVRSALRQLGDLDGDGHPEAVFRWSRAERFKVGDIESLGNLPGWVMFLLSWEGRRWQATLLMTGNGLSGVDTLEGIGPTDTIVVVEGLSNVPFPVLFQYQNHTALVAWDSRDENSRYQGYAGGTIEFESRNDAPPAMIASGRADPGVIRFSPRGQRGFGVATAYFWENGAYIPKKTEFEENEDYTLYRFIAALHLHDFKSAFSLADPAAFLHDRDQTLDEFRKTVQGTWPEFLGNNIFEALEEESSGKNPFAFSLDRGTVRTIYVPTFRRDRPLLLMGLVRRDVKRDVEEEPPGDTPR